MLHREQTSQGNSVCCVCVFFVVQNQIEIDCIRYRAQQSYESLKLTFGEHRCFLLQINSNPASNTDSAVDPWIKYLRRHPRSDPNQSSAEISAPRTPQDISVTMLPPTMQAGSPLETPPISMINEEVVDHPLSPVQEHATEAIVIN